MDTLLARLKPYNPRRGHVLRSYTYAGIRFREERGWLRVEKPVADYLRTVHQLPGNPYSPLAFDVCTDDEARALDAAETEASPARRKATDDIQLVKARPYGPAPVQVAVPPTPAPAPPPAPTPVQEALPVSTPAPVLVTPPPPSPTPAPPPAPAPVQQALNTDGDANAPPADSSPALPPRAALAYKGGEGPGARRRYRGPSWCLRRRTPLRPAPATPGLIRSPTV